MPRQTYFARSADIKPAWRIADADGQVLGRLATVVATHLMGKHRPEYTPHVDCGDFVIVTNAARVVLTGKKAQLKVRKTYSGYPGGLRLEPYGSVLKRRPTIIVEEAVRRMLPKSRLGDAMFRKLKVYAGAEHPHQAQMPVPLELSAAP